VDFADQSLMQEKPLFRDMSLTSEIILQETILDDKTLNMPFRQENINNGDINLTDEEPNISPKMNDPNKKKNFKAPKVHFNRNFNPVFD
jgi:hypothetical protein